MMGAESMSKRSSSRRPCKLICSTHRAACETPARSPFPRVSDQILLEAIATAGETLNRILRLAPALPPDVRTCL